MRPSAKSFHNGFTLVELVIVIVVLGVISVYAIERNASTAELTLSSQAQKMANDLRHVQALASTWGRSLTVTVSGSSYSVACATAGAAPCNISPVTDPSTGLSFTVNLQNGTGFNSAASVLTFDGFGNPGLGATYVLGAGNETSTVSVVATTGKVTPP